MCKLRKFGFVMICFGLNPKRFLFFFIFYLIEVQRLRKPFHSFRVFIFILINTSIICMSILIYVWG